MGGAYNRAEGTRDAFGALSDDLVREGHPRMVSKSGDRETQDQIDTFLSRYRPQATGSGPYGDVRWWQGVRYVRFSSAGTVAVPGNSNHERRRANDLAYPYNSTSTAAHKRARVLAQRYNITCEGLNFSEPWHWTFWGALGAIDGPALAGESKEWDDMATKQELKDALYEVLAGTYLGPGNRNHWDSLKFIADGAFAGTAERVWASPIAAQDGTGHVVVKDGKPVTYQAQGYLASIASQVGGTVAEVDEKALAAELAPLLTANLGVLSDADVARIATAAADEQARRMAS